MTTRSTLINDELHQVPEDLADAIAAIRMDAKKKKMKKEPMDEMDDEGEETPEEQAMDEEEGYYDSADSDEGEELDEEDLAKYIDSLEAENAVLAAITQQRQDAEFDEDEDDEDEDEFDVEEFVSENLEELVQTDSIEEYVVARLDSVLEAYEAAKAYLPTDFTLAGHADSYEIKEAALRHSYPHLDSDEEFNWDSIDAIDTAFAMLQRIGARRDSGYIGFADRAATQQRNDMCDGAKGGMGMKRKRKPSFSIE